MVRPIEISGFNATGALHATEEVFAMQQVASRRHTDHIMLERKEFSRGFRSWPPVLFWEAMVGE
jgi:hypothetical protein